jgi:hypothetical protein
MSMEREPTAKSAFRQFTDAQYAGWFERAMIIAQRSEADRLEVIQRLLMENHELRLKCASRVTTAKAQELILQIGKLMQERDKWKAMAQEMEGRNRKE